MSLDVYLYAPDVDGNEVCVYTGNVTHNLGKMADAAGVYQPMWRPEEIPVTHARDLLPLLSDGLTALAETPIYFQTFNPANGWGSYDGLVRFVREYRDACHFHPSARIETWR
jgi:hypothetical protein